MKRLTMNEQIFLIAIWLLKNEAYGVKIRKKITVTVLNTIATCGDSTEKLPYRNGCEKTLGETRASCPQDCTSTGGGGGGGSIRPPSEEVDVPEELGGGKMQSARLIGEVWIQDDLWQTVQDLRGQLSHFIEKGEK